MRSDQDGEPARRRHPEALDDPGLQLEDRPEAGGRPAGEGQQGDDARQEDVEHAPARQGRRPREVLEQRGEQGQVEDGGGEAHEQPDRIAQHLDGLALEQEADLAGRPHAATPSGAPEASRSDRPVWRRKTSSRVGSDRLIDRRPMRRPVEQAEELGQRGAPVLDVEPQLVALGGDLPHGTARRRAARSARSAVLRSFRLTTTASPATWRLSSRGVPSATIRPWSMIITRSQRSSASSR